MMFTTSTAATLALALLGNANAHMFMTNPKPYAFGALSTSPLGAGIAFPCHTGGGYQPQYSAEKGTAAQAGQSINVKFDGSAVHGGGTCQFSVAYLENGAPPSDPSGWKVIHTIAKGCPAETEGNLVEGPKDFASRPSGKQCPPGQESTGTDCVRSFDIPLPKDLKNGQAVFAWTWFNKVGNREMYMNCAPIEITGGVDDDSGLGALPSVFVANLPGKCTTTEGGVLGIPQAFVGASVDGTVDYGANAGTCASEGGNGGNGGNDNANTTPPPTNETSPQNPGNEFAPSPSPAPANPPAQSPPEQPAESPQETPAQPPVETAPAPGASGSVPCTNEGGIVCIGDSQWGLCNRGTAVPQALAAGTVCGSGSIAAMAAKRHVHRHLRVHPRSFK